MDQSRRKQLEDWFQTEVAEREAVNLPDMTAKAVAVFAENRAFVRGLLAEVLRPIVYEIGKAYLRKTRGTRVVELGDEIVTDGEFKRRSAVLRSRFATWMEHAGDRHVNFMKMDRKDLELAAAEREGRAETELRIARFERFVAEGLQQDQKVEDRYSPDDLEDMWQRVDETVGV